MNKTTAWIVVSILPFLGACDSSEDPAPIQPVTGLSAHNQAIAERLYTGVPRVPEGFVTDPVPTEYLQVSRYGQVATYHIKSYHIRPGDPIEYDVCTDNWVQALEWSEAVAKSAPKYLNLVANYTTDMYYQFDRVEEGAPDRFVRMRVFRCAYVNRTGADASVGSFAGFLNQPYTENVLRGVTEYLWLFTIYNNSPYIVVSSYSGERSHTIEIAELQRGGECDTMSVYDWTHTVDAYGVLTRSSTYFRAFRVKRTSGVVTEC